MFTKVIFAELYNNIGEFKNNRSSIICFLGQKNNFMYS